MSESCALFEPDMTQWLGRLAEYIKIRVLLDGCNLYIRAFHQSFEEMYNVV